MLSGLREYIRDQNRKSIQSAIGQFASFYFKLQFLKHRPREILF